MSWIAAARARLHLLFAPRSAEARTNEEMDFHIAMETDRLVREERLSPEDARRRALATFGGVSQHREELRDGRGVGALAGLSLDFKLGFRMLLRYPGLTLVGGLAMAFAIWIGAGVFEIATQIIRPRLPLPDGSAIVAISAPIAGSSATSSRAKGAVSQWRSRR